MEFFAVVIAKFLDPISFIVVLTVSFFSREKWFIPVAAIIGAVTSESLLASTQIARSWGQGIVPGIIASGVHALLCYWLVGKFKKKLANKES